MGEGDGVRGGVALGESCTGDCLGVGEKTSGIISDSGSENAAKTSWTLCALTGLTAF